MCDGLGVEASGGGIAAASAGSGSSGRSTARVLGVSTGGTMTVRPGPTTALIRPPRVPPVGWSVGSINLDVAVSGAEIEEGVAARLVEVGGASKAVLHVWMTDEEELA